MQCLTADQRKLVEQLLPIARQEARRASRHGYRASYDELEAAAYRELVEASLRPAGLTRSRGMAAVACRRAVMREAYLLYRSHVGAKRIAYGDVPELVERGPEPLEILIARDESDRLYRAVDRLRPGPRAAVMARLAGLEPDRLMRSLYRRALITLRESMTP
jgi:hypothetical protein